LGKATKVAEESLKKAKLAMKARWDKNKRTMESFAQGDLVLVMADHLPSSRPSKKLDQKWQGPFKVVKKIGEAAYELKLLNSWCEETEFLTKDR
jgi:hypothetical protein